MSNHITHLSFTRLKELAHSPLALKRYIEETKKSTRAMDEGTLLDCLLFEPETFKMDVSTSSFGIAPADNSWVFSVEYPFSNYDILQLLS